MLWICRPWWIMRRRKPSCHGAAGHSFQLHSSSNVTNVLAPVKGQWRGETHNHQSGVADVMLNGRAISGYQECLKTLDSIVCCSLPMSRSWKCEWDKGFFFLRYKFFRRLAARVLRSDALGSRVLTSKTRCCWQVLTLLMTALMVPLARPIVRLVFERRAFDAAASRLVASLLVCCKSAVTSFLNVGRLEALVFTSSETKENKK